ncbi:hypothetical protein DFH28DRAFT_871413, partial [Melampsora americana]
TATAPAARKDVKNDILSLFATKTPTPNLQQTSQSSSAFGDLNGLNHQFGNMALTTGLSQPWSQTGQSTHQINSSNGLNMMNQQTHSTLNQTNSSSNNHHHHNNQLFDNLSDPWSSNNQLNKNDGFGNFSTATKPNSHNNGKDAFSDIWN